MPIHDWGERERRPRGVLRGRGASLRRVVSQAHLLSQSSAFVSCRVIWLRILVILCAIQEMLQVYCGFLLRSGRWYPVSNVSTSRATRLDRLPRELSVTVGLLRRQAESFATGPHMGTRRRSSDIRYGNPPRLPPVLTPTYPPWRPPRDRHSHRLSSFPVHDRSSTLTASRLRFHDLETEVWSKLCALRRTPSPGKTPWCLPIAASPPRMPTGMCSYQTSPGARPTPSPGTEGRSLHVGVCACGERRLHGEPSNASVEFRPWLLSPMAPTAASPGNSATTTFSSRRAPEAPGARDGPAFLKTDRRAVSALDLSPRRRNSWGALDSAKLKSPPRPTSKVRRAR